MLKFSDQTVGEHLRVFKQFLDETHGAGGDRQFFENSEPFGARFLGDQLFGTPLQGFAVGPRFRLGWVPARLQAVVGEPQGFQQPAAQRITESADSDG